MEEFLKNKNIVVIVSKYMNAKTKRTLISFGIAVFCVASTAVWYVVASASTNIKVQYQYAWSENAGWLSFGSTDGGVMVTDTALTGYIWSENLGWISLNCSNTNSCDTSDYKVANDNEGNLSGYAWGENIGWVNFSPSNGGVHIDTSGNFSGYAWSENAGWIVFNCSDVDACATSDFKVATTWLPLSTRNQDAQDDVEVFDVHSSSTDTTIVINWDTNHDADSFVRFGKDRNLEKEKTENRKEKNHRLVLRELDPNTEYFFRVKSTDGNDSSDSSRIYAVSTKPSSTLFKARQWESLDKNGGNVDNENTYEKVEVKVQDKSDAEIRKEKKGSAPIESNANINTNADASISANTETEPSNLSYLFTLLKEKTADTFSGMRELALNGQRVVQDAFDWTGERIASAYDTIVSRFNKEKTTEIATINQAKFFTTQIFHQDDKKLLAEVRFQIMDPSDNPIPHLDTMLFSDPQSSVTDENGIVSFRDVPIGSHTLAFDYDGEAFRKKVAIADTLTEEGKVRAEVVEVRAEKEKIAVWMWAVIFLLIIALASALYFAVKYYTLKKDSMKTVSTVS
jgi:hypothetical protein